MQRSQLRAAAFPLPPVFFWTRGLWLIALELTVIGFAWQFIPGYSFAGVIWCLGWAMILLAALVFLVAQMRLPAWTITAHGAAILLLHNLSDHLNPASLGRFEPGWRLLHVPGPVEIGGISWFVLFPVLPWAAVMFLGYGLGDLYRGDAARRQKLLTGLGIAMTAAFIFLRITNSYGNPVRPGSTGASSPFQWHGFTPLTLISLLNVEKYPPSLQFLLMTLGPCLIALALFEKLQPAQSLTKFAANAATVFGRVPMFYYVLHLYIIHLSALVVALLWGQPSDWLKFGGQPIGLRDGYGHGLGFIYIAWIATVVALYFPCAWFMEYKRRNPAWWLRYL